MPPSSWIPRTAPVVFLLVLSLLGMGLQQPAHSASTARPARAPALSATIDDYAPLPLLVNDGAPADIWTLEQGPDGLLWLGTGMGLYRFDGLRFDRYPMRPGQRLLSSNINALKVTPDGDIWLGFFAGGVARLRDGRVTVYGPREGLPGGRLLRLALTRDGAVWAAAARGLGRFADGRWQTVGSEWGLGDTGVDYVYVDRRGALWVCTDRRLLMLPAGERRFRDTGVPVGRSAVVAEDTQGRLWLSDDRLGTLPLREADADLPPPLSPLSTPTAAASTSTAAPARPSAAEVPPAFGAAKQLAFARDGSLWMTVMGSGVWRLPAAASIPTGRLIAPTDPIQVFGRAQELPSPVVVPILEDQEGMVWAGTNNGLVGFQRKRLHDLAPLGTASVGGFAVARLGRGVVAANVDQALAVDPPGPPAPFTGPLPNRAVIGTVDGAVWTVQQHELLRWIDGRTERLPFPPGLTHGHVRAFLCDGQGGLWLSVVGRGVWRATPGTGVRPDPGFQDIPDPQAMARSPDGSVWMVYDDEVLHIVNGQPLRYGPSDGLVIGRGTTVHASEREVIVAGETGVARFEDGQFRSIPEDRDSAFGNVTGVAESPDGDLWLNGARGVVQLSAAEIARNFGATGRTVNYRLFDRRDGLPGIALQAWAVPTALSDRGGRLWFATNRGVAWLDPATVPRNERPPRTEIQQLRTGDTQHLPDNGLELPAGTQSLTLRFAAVTLVAADRVRFRYRLRGVDQDWHDAGAVREATYANLAPGRYRFQVVAANGDGVWDPVGASLDFAIAPTLTQTRLFAVTCVATVLLLGWLIYRMRARVIAHQVQMRLEERHRERERIARELHDTLLQGVQGLVLQFNSVARRIDEPELHDKMERALGNAEGLITAARDRVSDLRSTDGPLGDQLGHAAKELADGRQAVSLTVLGDEQPLRAAVRDELLMMAREAVANAVRHAGGERIDVTLDFDDRRVRLSVRDDGVGVDSAFTSLDGRPGHHGIKGLHERARRLRGALRIRRLAEGGTEVEVRILAPDAYVAASARSPWRRVAQRLRRRVADLVRARRGRRAGPR